MPVKIAQLNINGLAPKLSTLAALVRDLSLDIVCVTESHLIPLLSDSFVGIPHFNLLRNDVVGPVAKHGVCAYVKNNIMIGDIISHVPNVLAFHLVTLNVFILLAYRPPSNTPVDDENLCSFIVDFCVGKEVIVLGDFNLPNLDWSSSSPSMHAFPMERNFYTAFISLGLHQWVTEPTFPRSGNILDLIFTSEDDRIGALKVISPPPGCDHCLTAFDYVFTDFGPFGSQASAGKSDGPMRAWHEGHYGDIRLCLSAIDWDCQLASLNADESYCHFVSIIQNLIEEYIPHKPPANQKPPWSTRPPTSLINQRQKAWGHYKAIRGRLGRRSQEALSAYAAFRYLCKPTI